MTKHPQLTLDISKISLCNDAKGGKSGHSRIWGTDKDRVTWDNCIQYSALKPGEFLQFKNGNTGWRWRTVRPLLNYVQSNSVAKCSRLGLRMIRMYFQFLRHGFIDMLLLITDQAMSLFLMTLAKKIFIQVIID